MVILDSNLKILSTVSDNSMTTIASPQLIKNWQLFKWRIWARSPRGYSNGPKPPEQDRMTMTWIVEGTRIRGWPAKSCLDTNNGMKNNTFRTFCCQRHHKRRSSFSSRARDFTEFIKFLRSLIKVWIMLKENVNL